MHTFALNNTKRAIYFAACPILCEYYDALQSIFQFILSFKAVPPEDLDLRVYVPFSCLEILSSPSLILNSSSNDKIIPLPEEICQDPLHQIWEHVYCSCSPEGHFQFDVLAEHMAEEVVVRGFERCQAVLT